MLNFGEHVKSTEEKLQKRNTILKMIAGSHWGCTKKDTLSDLQSYRPQRPKLWCSHFGFDNQQHKLEQPANTTKLCSLHSYWRCENLDINAFVEEGQMQHVKAHTEMLAEHFLAGRYQGPRSDFKTTSSTSFLPKRPTLNDTYRDCVKKQADKKQLNLKENNNARKSIHQHTAYTQLKKRTKNNLINFYRR